MKIFQWIDFLVSKAITALLIFVAHIITLGLGIGLISNSISAIFEYDEALADLSNIEIIFFGLLAVLIYRHYKYCRYFNTSFWKMISSPIYALGLLALIIMTSLGLIILIWDWGWDLNTITEIENATTELSKIPDITYLVLFLISIYLSSPVKSTQSKINYPNTANDEQTPVSHSSSIVNSDNEISSETATP